ncbi:DUF3786 domain-containing protein [Chloroflexota bacterium]
MSDSEIPSGEDFDRFTRRVNELKEALSKKKPSYLAAAASAEFRPKDSDKGEFSLLLWGNEVCLSYPDFITQDRRTGNPLSQMDLVLLLYYFNTSDGTAKTGRWISFSELPDGKFYNQAFQGYTGQRLARSFRDDMAAFEHASTSLDGTPFPLGSASFSFKVLPLVSLLVVFWQGDEDFPSSLQILFDASASHYLPTDAYAIIGSMLASRLINVKNH